MSHARERSHGVMVSTLDFESSDPSSNLGGTLYSFIAFLLLLPEGVRWNKVTMLRQLNSQQRLPKVQSVQSTIQPVRAFFNHFVSDSSRECSSSLLSEPRCEMTSLLLKNFVIALINSVTGLRVVQLVVSIQSIWRSVWSWHDTQYVQQMLGYHLEFKVYLVSKPLVRVVFSKFCRRREVFSLAGCLKIVY